ncbi:MAG: DEAD/DEAH box helicase [Deltaproteobacteria bacterium]|nr:DEAD/DEAH box helicase [Deltaproteobacteria bacterium]
MNNQNASAPASSESHPESLKSFADFGLRPEIEEAISKMGFVAPTPVQAQCYECAVSGIDAVVMAQTGTGKTAAFGIPTVQGVNLEQNGVQALVLVPTRELALQVSKEISLIGSVLGSKCIPVYGGTSFSNQVRDYQAGAHIIVGTPGRILDHIKRKTIKFDQLRTMILDEADEMLSMGFEKELHEIMDALPETRQTLLFSATIPDDIRRLAGRYMGEFVTISVSGDAVGASEISHFVYLVSGEGRVGDLVRVLDEEQPGSAIIFCNTREETQFVSNSLCDNGYHAKAISSDLSQAEREKVIGQIRENKIQFLVATDIAARGIDISHLSHVINFSFPDSLERYIHRTGRTGRQGRHGAAISLITPHDIGNLYMLRLTYKIFPVEKKLPDLTDKALQDELSMLNYFRQSAKGTEVEPKYFSLATRVLHSSDAQYLTAVLLSQLFEAGKIQTTITMTGQSTPQMTANASAPKAAAGKGSSVPSKSATPPASTKPSVPTTSPNAVKEAASKSPEKAISTPAAPTPPAKVELTSNRVAPGNIPQVQPMPTPGPWGSARKSTPAPAPAPRPSGAPAAQAQQATAPVKTVEKSVPQPSTSKPSTAPGVSPKPSAPPAPSPVPLSPRSAGSNASAPAMVKLKADLESQWQSMTAGNATKPESEPLKTDQKAQQKVDESRTSRVSLGELTRSEDEILKERNSIIPDFTDAAASTDIYVDAGRSDGLKISALMKEIVEKSGLQRTDIGKVRMLTRSTFINVPNVNCEAVFKVLSAMSIDGRKLKVEYTEET